MFLLSPPITVRSSIVMVYLVLTLVLGELTTFTSCRKLGWGAQLQQQQQQQLEAQRRQHQRQQEHEHELEDELLEDEQEPVEIVLTRNLHDMANFVRTKHRKATQLLQQEQEEQNALERDPQYYAAQHCDWSNPNQVHWCLVNINHASQQQQQQPKQQHPEQRQQQQTPAASPTMLQDERQPQGVQDAMETIPSSTLSSWSMMTMTTTTTTTTTSATTSGSNSNHKNGAPIQTH